MIKNISIKLDFEELKDTKKLRLTRVMVDEMDPEDFIKQLGGIRGEIIANEETLKINREAIEDTIKKDKEIEAYFAPFENTAKLWKTENELMAKRTGKDVADIQKHRADFAPENAQLPDPEPAVIPEVKG